MKIARYDTINYTPAVVLAHMGWLEQNVDGIGEPNASIHWEQKGIVAFDDDNTPVGVITWTSQPSMKAIYAEQVFVRYEWRRRGFFKAMWGDLVAQAKALKIESIRLGTNPNNDVAKAVYEKMGGDVFAVFYQFDV